MTLGLFGPPVYTLALPGANAEGCGPRTQTGIRSPTRAITIPQMGNSEAELVSRAIGGNADALSELLNIHGPILRTQLSLDQRWQSVIELDDVLQVTYLEAFLRIGSFVPAGSAAFGAWLRRIAQNNLRDAVKGLDAQKRPPPAMQAVGGTDASTIALLDLMGVSATPSRAASGREANQALDAALAALPADYSMVIRMYDLQGHDIADVATGLGRSAGAVHMLRARAHDRLRELLGPESQFFSHRA